VIVIDLPRVRHSVEVTADTLFDAAGQALAALRSDAWTDAIGPATRLEVQVLEPVTTHSLTVQQLERWANGAAVSPEERLRKDRVKTLITRPTRLAE
jgi:hypothetical protein